MSPQTFATSLDALRNAGSVFGILLTKGHEILYQDTAIPEPRLTELATILDDIAYYFEQEERSPDQLSFGFDGGNLLIQLRGDLRMIVFHHQAHEIDYLARASAAFLKDYGMSILVDEWGAETAVTV
jgi:hypothetical protein